MQTETARIVAAHAQRELGRRRLLDFTKYTFPNYQDNWHHKKICEALEAIERHDIRKLIITLGPRRGKSELVSRRFPAWLFGRNPDIQIIGASYGQSLANKMSRDVQRIMSGKKYSDIFDVDFGDRKAYEEFTTDGGGSYKAVGVGVGIAGFGANVGIIDDFFGTREDAESPTKRDKVWDWYNDDFCNRLEYPASQIVMATRWHHDDLIGRILNSPEAEEWEVIHLPEILDVEEPGPYDHREYGEPLWPDNSRAPWATPGMSDDELIAANIEWAEAEQENNAYGFEAMYQGRPSPREGGMFQREWFQHYKAHPSEIARSCSQLIISVDATFKKSKRSDKVAMLVAGFRGGQIFVLDEVFAKMDFPATKRRLKALRNKWPRASVVIEDKANGPALISDLRSEMSRVIAHDPGKESKDSRAQMAANWFEAGQIMLPDSSLAPWIGDWMEDFAGYPNRPFDDRIDALSQVVMRWDKKRNAREHILRIVGDG